MQLSERLENLAAMVTPGSRLVDVGCDHGYLPIALIERGQIASAIAMDVNKGPLERAREHIAQCGLQEKIATRLSDGLSALAPGEGDTLVIAGMGGPLMKRILTEGKNVRESFEELILQPQSDIPHFRSFIRAEGWEIVEERMVLEDGKYYPMMRVKRVPLGEPYLPEETWFGRLLLRERHQVLKQYLLREQRIREQILESLQKAEQSTAEARAQQVKEELLLIEAALRRYED